jgi:hypothetical protein
MGGGCAGPTHTHTRTSHASLLGGACMGSVRVCVLDPHTRTPARHTPHACSRGMFTVGVGRGGGIGKVVGTAQTPAHTPRTSSSLHPTVATPLPWHSWSLGPAATRQENRDGKDTSTLSSDCSAFQHNALQLVRAEIPCARDSTPSHHYQQQEQQKQQAMGTWYFFSCLSMARSLTRLRRQRCTMMAFRMTSRMPSPSRSLAIMRTHSHSMC